MAGPPLRKRNAKDFTYPLPSESLRTVLVAHPPRLQWRTDPLLAIGRSMA